MGDAQRSPWSPRLSPWGDPSAPPDARSPPAPHSSSPSVVSKDWHRAQAGITEGTGPEHPPLRHGAAAVIAPVLLLRPRSFLQLPCQLPAPLCLSSGQRRGLLGLTPCQPGLLHGGRVSPRSPALGPPGSHCPQAHLLQELDLVLQELVDMLRLLLPLLILLLEHCLAAGRLVLRSHPARHSTAWHGTVWHSTVWHSVLWHGMACDTAQYGMAWHGTAWLLTT